jgi:transcriptional regulator with XRE-family HTH domain
MADVIRIAKERRARLVAEIAKLDSFIRMAEVLVKYDQDLNHGLAMDADPTAATTFLVKRDGDAEIFHQGKNSSDAVSAPSIVEATNALETAPDAAKTDTGVQKITVKPEAVHNDFGGHVGTQSIAAFPAGADHFAFNDKDSAGEEELVLDNPLAGSTASVDVHVGQRMRQRRWMMGMTQQQLGDLVGVKFEQIQKYETGAIHIGAGRMWDVAAAMEVPMSYFFEGIEGQAADTGEARSEILNDKDALALVHGGPQAQKAQAS